MSYPGKQRRGRSAGAWRLDKLIVAVVLLVAAIQFVWREPGVSELDRAGTAVRTVIGYEVRTYQAVRVRLGHLLAVLDRNRDTDRSRRGCIQTGCPAHLVDGKTAIEG